MTSLFAMLVSYFLLVTIINTPYFILCRYGNTHFLPVCLTFRSNLTNA